MKDLPILWLLFVIFIGCKTDKTAIRKTTKITVNKQKPLQETITFPSKDGLTITADVYWTKNKKNPFILLFHQARFSRGEYIETAKKLNDLGFNCMAIDQRSGHKVNGIINQTHLAAITKKLPTKYPDALPDLEASIDFVLKNYKPKKLVILGSSYSSSLVFIVGTRYQDKINAIISFSPGEYFTYNEKQIKDFAKKITIPVFITAAKNETKNWSPIFKAIPTDKKVGFIPKHEGKHGSKTLWSSYENNKEYWIAIRQFLKEI